MSLQAVLILNQHWLGQKYIHISISKYYTLLVKRAMKEYFTDRKKIIALYTIKVQVPSDSIFCSVQFIILKLIDPYEIYKKR